MNSAFTPRQTAAASGALVLANARYWVSVAPLVRMHLSRWELRARTIPDPALHALANHNLLHGRFDVEVATTLATLAPRAWRSGAVEAIVALQIMYGYLDVLTERPAAGELLPEPASNGRDLFQALVDSLSTGNLPSGDCYYRGMPHLRDDGYLRALVDTVRLSLGGLPAAAAVGEVARHAAGRCAKAQVLGHTATRSQIADIEGWATSEAGGSTLQWPEFMAGAQASVLSLHALIAAAADERTTRDDARRIDAAYLSIGGLTMLDSLIDREQDLASGGVSYLDFYENPEQMGTRLADVARDAALRTRMLPHGGHHTVTLVGVVSYYASAPAASEPLARPVFGRVLGELKPLTAPTLAVMRAWRMTKRRHRLRTRRTDNIGHFCLTRLRRCASK
jgi:hypothetical protein